MKKRVSERKCIFIGCVQKELQHERRAIKEFVEGDALLRRYFDVFLFEDLPASDRKADVIASLNLNDRQQRVLTHLMTAGRIGNTEYQSLLGVARRTAHRDLTDLVQKGVLEKVGTTGKGTTYILSKRATNGPKGPSAPAERKGASKGPKGS